MRHHERCWLLKTAGRWPWKLESAKECVTTHLPKQLALKMDGAQALNLHLTVNGNHLTCLGIMYALTSRKNVVIPSKVSDVSQPGGVTITDLGGSSKYSSETLEDQCGEGFHVNSS